MLIFLLSACNKAGEQQELKRYQASFLTLFDTVTNIIGYAEDESIFKAEVQEIHDELEVYHQLYDIYNDYPGINNLKTINDNAGLSPVVVDRRIIDLLLFCKEMYERTGVVNVAMGSVLSIWHDARSEGIDNPESAALPAMEDLKAASEHMNLDDVIIDEAASTVFLADPLMSLDVGAVAKGYAVEMVSRKIKGSFLLSVGGNVSASGPKPDGSSWIVGLQDPESAMGKNKHSVYLDKGSVVTSGDYQRYYVVDGNTYHHIIDPVTLMPGVYWKAVSVIADDSAVADVLSTALFLLPESEGQLLLDEAGAFALWTNLDGSEKYSRGFEAKMRT